MFRITWMLHATISWSVVVDAPAPPQIAVYDFDSDFTSTDDDVDAVASDPYVALDHFLDSRCQ